MCSNPVILRGSFTRKGACALVRAVRRRRAFIGTDLTVAPDLFINIVLSAFVHAHSFNISVDGKDQKTQWSIQMIN